MNSYELWVLRTNQQLRLGDRVVVEKKVGHVHRLNDTHAQIRFLDDKIGTYPKYMVQLRNDLVLEKK